MLGNDYIACVIAADRTGFDCTPGDGLVICAVVGAESVNLVSVGNYECRTTCGLDSQAVVSCGDTKGRKGLVPDDFVCGTFYCNAFLNVVTGSAISTVLAAVVIVAFNIEIVLTALYVAPFE